MIPCDAKLRRGILATCAFACALACAAVAQAEGTITVSFDSAPLAAALKQLEQSSGLRLAFSDDLMKSAEPVTLSAKDEPVDDVLRAILRPRGMECVYTGETMAAVVPADSDVGMAKAAGRALRTFARLAKKLEGAVQAGDEVKVPEWTDEDDRVLAETIIDMVALGQLYELQQPYDPPGSDMIPFDGTYQSQQPNDPRLVDLTRLLAAYDHDVRIGACVAATYKGSQQRRTPADREAVTEAVRKTLADPDPSVRAGGVVVLACMRSSINDWQPAIRKALAESAKAAEPQIRFAAALAPAFTANDKIDPGLAITGRLRNDSHPAVRVAALRSWLLWQRYDLQLPREFAQAMAAEKNPVAKALAVILARSTYVRTVGWLPWPRGPESLLQRCSAQMEPINDPWLRLATSLGLSLADASESKAPRKKVNAAVEMLASLLASGKRSHQALAVTRMSPHLRWLIGNGNEPADLSKLAALADSPSLWPRLFGIMASGACTGDAAEGRVLQALKSNDGLVRAAGLLACADPLIYGSSKGGPPPALSSLRNGAAFREALVVALRSPCLTESTLAAGAFCQGLPFDDRLALFREEGRRKPHSIGATVLLHSLTQETRGAADRQDRLGKMVIGALIELKDPGFQILHLRSRSLWYQDQILAMIRDSETEAFFALLTLDDHNQKFILDNESYAVTAILDRLTVIFEKGGPHALEAVRALAAYTQTSYAYNKQHRPTTFALVDSMLAMCMADGASDEQLAAACALATGVFADYGPLAYSDFTWNDAPPRLRAALPRLLRCVDNKTLGSKVAGLVGAMYRRFDPLVAPTIDPALLGAMETCREKIMASDRVAGHAVLLTLMCGAKNDATAAVAQAQLEMLLMAGTVPAGGAAGEATGDLRMDAVAAIARYAQRVPPEFGQFLMSKVATRTEAPEFEQVAVQVLAHCPGEYSAMVDFLAKADEKFLDFAMARLSEGIRRERARLKDPTGPAPGWAKKPADFSLKIVNDTRRQSITRMKALGLYGQAAGAESAPFLEKMAMDESRDDGLRATAACVVVRVNPKTNILVKLLENYDKLPQHMREQMITGITSSNSAHDTPGKEAFLLRGLKDRGLRFAREQALVGLGLPRTDTFIAGLKELEQDPEIGAKVKKAIQLIEQNR